MQNKKWVYPLFILFLMIFGLILSSTSVSSSNIVDFSENILLSTSNSPYPHHVEPTLAISDNNTLFVGWKNANGPTSGGVKVSFTKSSDLGESWSPELHMPLFNQSIQTAQSDPWLLWNNDVLYFAYIEFDAQAPFARLERSQVTLAQSIDYGESWDLSRVTNNTGFADKETLTISPNGTILVAYGDVPQVGHNVMRLSYSTDNGTVFNDTIIISDDDGIRDQISPYVVTDSKGQIFVVWLKIATSDFRGYLALDSFVNGSFGIDTRLTDGNFAALTATSGGAPSKWTLPSIKFDSQDRLYLLWSDMSETEGTWDVYLKYSDDFGLNWTDKIRVNPSTPNHQWMPDMDIDKDDNLHIVYYEESEEQYRTYYQSVIVENNNLDVSDPIPVASEFTDASFSRPGDYLAVRVDSNLVTHTVWSDGRNNDMDIYYANCACIEAIASYTEPSTTEPQTSNFEFFSLFSSLIVVSLVYNKKRKD